MINFRFVYFRLMAVAIIIAPLNISANEDPAEVSGIWGLKYTAPEQGLKVEDGSVGFRFDLGLTLMGEDCRPYYEPAFKGFYDIAYQSEKCFESKVPLEKRKGLTDIELFRKDQDVCSCLYNSNVDMIRMTMKSQLDKNHGVRTLDMAAKEMARKAETLTKKASALQDGIRFQSHVLFSESKDPAKEAIKKQYQRGFASEIFKEKGSAQKIIHENQAEIVKKFNSKTKSWRNPVNKLFNPDQKLKGNVDLLEKVNQEIQFFDGKNKSAEVLAEPTFKENQCLGAKEFFSLKQFPEDPNFYKELISESNFSPEKWDYTKLDERLKIIADMPRAEDHNAEIDGIKARLRFLHRNPMLKMLMSADEQFEDYANKKGSELSGATKNYLEETSKKILAQKKQELFNIVKQNFTPKDSSCVTKGDSACQMEVVENVVKFDSKMKQFFADPDVSMLTQVQSEKATFKMLDDFVKEPLGDEELPQGQKELEDFVIDRVIVTPGNVNKGEAYTHPAECTINKSSVGATVDPRCIDTYAVYCPVVDKAVSQWRKNIVKRKSNGPKVKGITFQDYFEPDLYKNDEFNQVNEKFCSSPRPSKKGGASKSFNEFNQDFCRAHAKSPLCGERTYENILALRKKFEEEYLIPQGDARMQAISQVIENRSIENMDSATAHQVASNASSAVSSSSIEQFMKDLSGSEGKAAPGANASELFAAHPATEPKVNSLGSGNLESAGDFAAYSNVVASSQVAAPSVPRIENMTTESKEDLLNQWRDDLAEYKRNNQDSDEKKVSKQEMGLKAKIEALETMLDHQRKLTTEQYRLLNEAIANRSEVKAPALAGTDESEEVPLKSRSSSGFTTSSAASGLSDEVFRAPASINESFATSGSAGGSAGSASTQRSSSHSGAQASSSESLAREEAKLVNLRRFADGSVTIEAGVGSKSSVNAITLSVSDEQYRLLQSNPSALNLSQIESSIPKEQLERLEKSGQIILVLQNGSNPPFEVKVEKKDNKLVYQLQDNDGKKINPVKRIYTRQALELELRVQ